MEQIINPILLYSLVVVGAVGVLMALPRKAVRPQIFGALLAGLAAGGVILALSLRDRAQVPVPFFYIFGVIALGSALRVITHARPVYAALWFIMVVLASGGLLLLLSAEFMMAALIIVYAGAILITYLFVIMLATQAPEEGETEVLAQYDTEAREPVAATIVGFVLLALLTTMLFRGVPALQKPGDFQPDALLAEMPRKVERELRQAGLLKEGESVRVGDQNKLLVMNPDAKDGFILVANAAGGADRRIERKDWPESLRATNVEHVGFSLLRDHPGSIEIAGVILLMAMLGATVLSRKQVQLDEEAKMHESRRLGLMAGGSGAYSGSEGGTP